MPSIRTRECDSKEIYSRILAIWPDDELELKSRSDGSFDTTHIASVLAEHLRDGRSLIWVHLGVNDPNIFDRFLEQSPLASHERLRKAFKDLFHSSDLQNRHFYGKERTIASKSLIFDYGFDTASLVLMPIVQYERFDQNQKKADTERVFDATGRLVKRAATFNKDNGHVDSGKAKVPKRPRAGGFRAILPVEDQMWAAHHKGFLLTSAPYREERDVFRHLAIHLRFRGIPRDDFLETRIKIFSMVLGVCMQNPSTFLTASKVAVDDASNDRAFNSNTLHSLLETLPSPEEKSYDSSLRRIIDQLIRIQRELRWLNSLSSILEDITLFNRTWEKQMEVVQGQVKFDWRRQIGYKRPKALYETHERFYLALEDWELAMHTQGEKMHELESQATVVRAMMSELFEFKQSLSNVFSSQFQLRQADASTRSGNIIMYFTMMTILFSSLSFMAAFFALNVRSFPRNEEGDVELSMSYVTSRIVAWSIAIAAPFWLWAAFLNPMADFFSRILPGWVSGGTAEKDEQEMPPVPQNIRRRDTAV